VEKNLFIMFERDLLVVVSSGGIKFRIPQIVGIYYGSKSTIKYCFVFLGGSRGIGGWPEVGFRGVSAHSLF
jgi:hypothetical protein